MRIKVRILLTQPGADEGLFLVVPEGNALRHLAQPEIPEHWDVTDIELHCAVVACLGFGEKACKSLRLAFGNIVTLVLLQLEGRARRRLYLTDMMNQEVDSAGVDEKCTMAYQRREVT